MRTLLTRARWIAIGLVLASLSVLYAQEQARFERGINILRGNLTMSAGDIVLSSTSDVQATSGQNLILRTALLSNSVRLNSITDATTTSGDLIGFQSKPRAGIGGSQSIYGGQVSAQISNAMALTGSGSLIGLHADVYVRGTSAGAIAGDVRGMQIELTTDDAGTRDITGYVTALRIRKAFSAGTVTGQQSVMRIEVPETQTNSETYTTVFDLTGTIPLVWNSAPGTEPSTADGYIKVRVNGADRYIQLYSGAPID